MNAPVRGRLRSGVSWLLALTLSGVVVLGASLRSLQAGSGDVTLPPARSWEGCAVGAPDAPPRSGADTLIVTGDGQPLSQVYGTLAANLASHFGRVRVVQASDYQPRMVANYRALVYIGGSTGRRLPPDLLDDVRTGGRPVLWLGGDIEQLAAAAPADFRKLYGWLPGPERRRHVKEIRYRGTALSRDPENTDPIRSFRSLDHGTVRVLGKVATARKSYPWAVQSGGLTYVAEVPLDAAAENDRYLAVADMLQGLLARPAPPRHRALVRLEDIGPEADPAAVKAVGRLLHEKKVPFSFGVYPRYRGPLREGPNRRDIGLADRPRLVRAITYLLEHGGTMVLHGYSHQSDFGPNPDTGESGQDFEFFRTHWSRNRTLVYDGPVPGDSVAWADRRFDAAGGQLRAAHLPMPRMVEFPHYAASIADYRAAGRRFAARYDRGQYFSPAWNGRDAASPYMFEQFAPYLIRDHYGSVVVPENLGFVEERARPGHGEGTVDAIVANARAQLVVRDNVASFFYHPFLGTKPLADAVDRIKALGYRFVSPCDL